MSIMITDYKAYLSAITVTNIYQSFTYKMAAKINVTVTLSILYTHRDSLLYGQNWLQFLFVIKRLL